MAGSASKTAFEGSMIRTIRSGWMKSLLVSLLLGLAGTASAQQPTQAQAGAIKQSCRSDYQSFCSSVPTGGSAALQCLQGHISNVSPSCQTALNAIGGSSSSPPAAQSSQGAPTAAAPAVPMRQQMAMLRRSCGMDYRSYCRGVEPGGGRALACLAQNKSRLSPSCKGALAAAQRAR